MRQPCGRYDWYQDANSLSIVLYTNSVVPDSVNVAWSNGTLSITYTVATSSDDGVATNESNSGEANRIDLTLFAPIADSCGASNVYNIECSKNKVEIRLPKANSGWWPVLEKKRDLQSTKPPTYSKLLRDMYARGDDDTRRAMAKSFVGLFTGIERRGTEHIWRYCAVY
ncbi:hypothetical protein BBBOND_0204790 [Babesia bigemina]|uniref:CS domain-containing protein n=1 Tax=Babesia bigemina TaxID=5866 RepID=A0A061D3P8_BABBI|nr:hypothetical protein BBBOND_0204790 [Babesia bigemina]CDR95321.1 hypothetical protein BBBOND_0204790 [Babesia bigemina]|eukprot:XP_012767507.1 hypothetical protein BBBOND_0204790 [Babesia bigemina]